MSYKMFVAGDQELPVAFYIEDCRRSALRVATYLIELFPREAVELALNELFDLQDQTELHPIVIILEKEEEFPPSIIAASLAVFSLKALEFDEKDSPEDFEELSIWGNYLWEKQSISEEWRKLVEPLLDVTSDLLYLRQAQTLVEPWLSRAASNFYNLASLFVNMEEFDLGLACSASASNLFSAYDTLLTRQAAALSLQIARQTQSADAVNQLITNLAIRSLLALQDNPTAENKLYAFDAVEMALLNLPAEAELRDPLVSILRDTFRQEDYWRPLLPLLYLALPKDPSHTDNVAPISDEQLQAAYSMHTDKGLEEWVNYLDVNRLLMCDVENQRLELMSQAQDRKPHMAWSSLTVNHPHYRRAVPTGKSILNEDKKAEILLNLQHEMTHAFSLMGWLGTVTTLLRAAQGQLEMEMWSRLWLGLNEPVEDIWQSPHPAPLQKLSSATWDQRAIALAFAEQAIDLERKIQILQNVWLPWLEGLAVFAEVSVDPALDPNWASPIGETIHNLWDRNIMAEAHDEPQNFERVFLDERIVGEVEFSQLMRRYGATILGVYFGPTDWRNYLPGYLALRSIVSAWRLKLQRPLRGDEAFRALLHITRYSDSAELLPSIALSLDEFRTQCVALHVRWLENMACISDNDLTTIMPIVSSTEREAPSWWREGRLIRGKDAEDATRSLVERELENIREAMVQWRAQPLSPERLPGVAEDCQFAVQTIFSALANYKQQLVLAQSWQTYLNRLTIMPLGQVEAPFWLLDQNRMLACLLRTREKDSKTHAPGYNLMVIPLSPELFESLSHAIDQRGERRMQVTRIVDLATNVDDRLSGHQYMVFQYGDWIYTRAVGTWIGLEHVPDSLEQNIRVRLGGNPVIVWMQTMTDECHLGAQRTCDWLKGSYSEQWVLDFQDTQIDLAPWKEAVLASAQQVISEPTDEIEIVGHRLIEFVYGQTKLSKEIQENGLKHVFSTSHRNSFLKALDRSARHPYEDNTPTPFPSLPKVFGNIGSMMSWGWDIVPPTIYRNSN